MTFGVISNRVPYVVYLQIRCYNSLQEIVKGPKSA